MISCKRAAELISLSQEAPLGWRRRLALALHLAVCAMCRRFRRHVRLLERAGRAAPGPDAPADVALPPAAKERIKRALRDQGAAGAGEGKV